MKIEIIPNFDKKIKVTKRMQQILDKVRKLEKQYKTRNSIKIVVASVNFTKNSYFEWFTGDFDDYLVKPFKEIDFIEKVIELGE